jgi:hypothetical protein
MIAIWIVLVLGTLLETSLETMGIQILAGPVMMVCTTSSNLLFTYYITDCYNDQNMDTDEGEDDDGLSDENQCNEALENDSAAGMEARASGNDDNGNEDDAHIIELTSTSQTKESYEVKHFPGAGAGVPIDCYNTVRTPYIMQT